MLCFSEDAVILTDAVPAQSFTRLVERHLAMVPDTAQLESEGAQLLASNFPEPELSAFVRKVCKWGGYPGIAGRVLKRNEIATIRDRFVAAADVLAGLQPGVGLALAHLNHINGFGTPSFASKHLRFMRPDLCPVLDSVVRDNLGYAFDADGYRRFADDCRRVSDFLQARSVSNPMVRKTGLWFAGDVDMAVYAHLQGWR